MRVWLHESLAVMGNSSGAVFVGLLVAAIGLIVGCAPDIPRILTVQSDAVAMEEVAIRDDLIASQQAILNAFRCQFEFDTQMVPGGCVDGRPGTGSVKPEVFTGVPTRQDLVARDELIRVQEALLNDYRCRFGIDAHAVPGGCPDEGDGAGA